MSLKYEIETWASALDAHDRDDHQTALRLFLSIGDNSKIMFNMALIRATLGEHNAAVELLSAAIRCDNFFAVAHHQKGVSNFLLGRFGEARRNFDDAFLHLRGNEFINYQQIGLDFNLFAAEVLFNRGLCDIYIGNTRAGLSDLNLARQRKQTPEHDVIDEAFDARGERYTVFSIPVGVLYRPAASKVRNAKSKDYLPRAKLVAATDTSDTSIGFTPRPKIIEPPHFFRPADLARSKTTGGNGLARMFSRRKQSEPTLLRSNTDPPHVPSIGSSSFPRARPARSNTLNPTTKHVPPPLSFHPRHLPAHPVDGSLPTVTTQFASSRHGRSDTYGGSLGLGGRGEMGAGERGQCIETPRRSEGHSQREEEEEEEEEERIVFAAGVEMLEEEEERRGESMDRERKGDLDQSVIDEVYGDYYSSFDDDDLPTPSIATVDNRLSTKAIFHLPTSPDPSVAAPVSPYTSPRALPPHPLHSHGHGHPHTHHRQLRSQPIDAPEWLQTSSFRHGLSPANSSSISSLPTLSSASSSSSTPSHSRSSTLSSIHTNPHHHHNPEPMITSLSSSAALSSNSPQIPLTTPPLPTQHGLSLLCRSVTLDSTSRRCNSSSTSCRLDNDNDNDYFSLLSLLEKDVSGREEKTVLGDRRCAVKIVDPRTAGSVLGVAAVEEEEAKIGLGIVPAREEMTRVRLLIHHDSEIRALTFPTTSSSSHSDPPTTTTTTLPTLLSRLCTKFSLPHSEPLKIEFVDEVGRMKIRLADEDDFEVALDVARINARGRSEGWLEIWINA